MRWLVLDLGKRASPLVHGSAYADWALADRYHHPDCAPIEKEVGFPHPNTRLRIRCNICGRLHVSIENSKPRSKAWLVKLRNDQRRAKAELAVLVSVALPKDTRHFAQVDGIWVTQFALALGLASALRANLIQVAELKLSSKDKHEKMELLYGYLSSTEFRHRIEAIVEAFRSMQDDLEKERETMERQWAKREKQTQLVVQNVSGMYADMQGIAGHSLPKIRQLELPASSA